MNEKRVLIAVACAACTFVLGKGGVPPQGVVVEEGTNAPMADVFIIAEETNHGSDLVGSRSSCKGISIVKSDQEGRFPLVPSTRDAREAAGIAAYKPGYQSHGTDPAAMEFKMRRVAPTDEGYMRALAFVTSPRCKRVNDKAILMEYYATKSRELAQLLEQSPSPRLRRIQNELRYQMDVLRLGEDEAEKRRDAGEYSK